MNRKTAMLSVLLCLLCLLCACQEPEAPVSSFPMPESSSSQTESLEPLPTPTYPREYTPLTGLLTEPLPLDLYWYYDPLIVDADNIPLGYLSADGDIVWNTTDADIRLRTRQLIQSERPWLKGAGAIETFLWNGSRAVAGGRLIGAPSQADSLPALRAEEFNAMTDEWNNVRFLLFDESQNDACPIAYTEDHRICGIEIKEDTSPAVFQTFSLAEEPIVMASLQSVLHEPSACLYGVMTALRTDGTLVTTQLPLTLGLNYGQIQSNLTAYGPSALPTPSYPYQSVVSFYPVTTEGGASLLLLLQNGMLMTVSADPTQNEFSLLARQITYIARDDLPTDSDSSTASFLLIDEKGRVARLTVPSSNSPVLEQVGTCRSPKTVVSIAHGYAVYRDGTLQKLDRSGNGLLTFFDYVTDVKLPSAL